MEIVYEKPKFLKVIFFKEKKYIMFKWYSFGIPLADIKVAHQKALDTLLQNGCYIYIAETSEATNTLIKPVIDWWSTEWVPKLQESRIKAIVTVVPESMLATMSTKDWQTVDFGGIAIKNVKTLEEAENFLTTIS